MQSRGDMNGLDVLIQLPFFGESLSVTAIPLTDPRVWLVVFALRDVIESIYTAGNLLPATHRNHQCFPNMSTFVDVLVEHRLASQDRITVSPLASHRHSSTQQLVDLQCWMTRSSVEPVWNELWLNELCLCFVDYVEWNVSR